MYSLVHSTVSAGFSAVLDGSRPCSCWLMASDRAVASEPAADEHRWRPVRCSYRKPSGVPHSCAVAVAVPRLHHPHLRFAGHPVVLRFTGHPLAVTAAPTVLYCTVLYCSAVSLSHCFAVSLTRHPAIAPLLLSPVLLFRSPPPDSRTSRYCAVATHPVALSAVTHSAPGFAVAAVAHWTPGLPVPAVAYWTPS